MNILLTSAGRRVQVVQYFKKELWGKGNIIATDCDITAPALHFADRYEQAPKIDDPFYFSFLQEMIIKYDVQAVLSLIDPELSLLAAHKEDFNKMNTIAVISDQEVTSLCLDKRLTYEFLKRQGIPCIPTYITLEEVEQALLCKEMSFPIIVKPRRGSASIGVSRVDRMEELEKRISQEDVIVQPLLTGDEYGVDAYVDTITGMPVSIFLKKKIRMRAGETDRSVSVKDHRLFDLIRETIEKLKPIGPIDIDCFLTENGFVISEINPRFGGGFPHAYESGENFIEYLLKNLAGIPNAARIGMYQEDTVMMKYDQSRLINFSTQSKRTIS